MKVTKAEARILRWALGAMEDIAYNEDYRVEDEWYDPEHLPILKGRTLDLSNASDDAIEDLLYRIEEQMPEMTEGEVGAKRAGPTIAMCDRLAEKIRSA